MPRLGDVRLNHYGEALDFLGERPERKLAHNTFIFRTEEGTIYVRYHRTNIVIFHLDGSIELNSGGWETSTTKRRLNLFSPGDVYQKDHVWYVASDGLPEPFFDGIRVNPRGEIINTS